MIVQDDSAQEVENNPPQLVQQIVSTPKNPLSPTAEIEYLRSTISILTNKFSLSDYEAEFLMNLNKEIRRPAPSTKIEILNRLSLLDNYRGRLQNMIYMLSNKFSEIEFEYKENYNAAYTRLVRAARPSHAAIEAEIHMDIGMHQKQKLLSNFEQFKMLLTGYLKTMDNAKSTLLAKLSST